TSAWARRKSSGAGMIKAAAERERVALGIDDRKARLPALDSADARERHAELAGERLDFAAPLARRGKEKLVIVSAGQHAVLFELRVVQLREGGEPRNFGVAHERAHVRALEDVLQVARH